ncbi:MAG TPA: sugar phosphate isomerase/epimerase family protein [Methylomirabilota bacterium]|nr:sugar phosphate isomerase/epimerase family protein [Methylomirabilota bacterium]
MKFGICNEIFQDWKIDDAMTFAKKAGYDGIEIAPFTLAKNVTEIPAAERTRIRNAAARLELEISGIHWVLVQAEGMYLNHPDAEVRTRTARYFCDLVNFCADLGGKIIVVGSPKQRNLMEGVTFEQGWEWATNTFRDAVKLAEERGITICFEPLAPSETNFINTAAEAIRFTKQFNNPAMKIILDVKAMCSESKPIPQIIRESRGEFAYFHANDRNLKGPGFGDVDFVPIAAALKEAGYEGYASVEVFKFEEGAEAIATRSIDYLKRVFV